MQHKDEPEPLRTVCGELSELALRRMWRTYQRVGENGPLDLPAISLIIEQHTSVATSASPDDRLEALNRTLTDAINELPDQVMPGTEINWRLAATILFGVNANEYDSGNGKKKYYERALDSLTSRAGLYKSRRGTTRDLSHPIRQRVARALLDLEAQLTSEDVTSPVESLRETARQPQYLVSDSVSTSGEEHESEYTVERTESSASRRMTFAELLHRWDERITWRHVTAAVTTIFALCLVAGDVVSSTSTRAPILPPALQNASLYHAYPGTQCAVLYQCAQLSSGVTANLGIANVSAGGTDYQSSVNASYNDVVDCEILYENLKQAAPDVGVTLQLEPPTQQGRNWRVAWRVTAGSSSIEVSTTVQLNRTDARLVFIPGSAHWRHNSASPGSPMTYRTETIPDDTVLAPSEPLETLHAGGSYAASIEVQFRVEVPGLSATLLVNTLQQTSWMQLQTLYIKPPETISVAIELEDDGNTNLYGVVVAADVPQGTEYVPGSSVAASSINAAGVPVPDGIINQHDPQGIHRVGPLAGVNIGTLIPSQTVIVRFQIHLSTAIGANPVQIVSLAAATDLVQRYCVLDLQPESTN